MHIIRYMINGVLVRALGIISLPIYTYFLSPSEYGMYTLILSYISIGILIFTLNVHSSISRFYYEDKVNKEEFLSSSIWLSVIIFFTSFLAISLFDSQWLSSILTIDYEIYSKWIFLIIFFKIFFSIYTQVLIPQKKSKEYTKITLIKSISVFTFCCTLLYFNPETMSLIYAYVVVEGCIFLYVIYKLKDQVKFKISRESVDYILSYSVFLLPYSLSGIILSQIDRVMLAQYLSLDAVGIYSVAYALSMIPWTIFVMFSKGWTPEYFEHMNKKNYHNLDRDVKYILLATSYILLFMAIFSTDIINFLFNNEFTTTDEILPILISSVLFMILWQMWGRGIGYSKKTIWTSIIGFISAVINVCLNYYLIPVYGIVGAAYATLISYFMMAILGYVISCYVLKIYTVSIYKLRYIFLFNIFLFSIPLMDNAILIVFKAIFILFSIYILIRYRKLALSKFNNLIKG